MSEYQYYEFQAIDRPLSESEARALRALSTRARITSTSFVNTYEWGNFKGKPSALMEQCFDAFLYLANWGTRELMPRVPGRLLDSRTASLYSAGNHASVKVKGENIMTRLSRRVVRILNPPSSMPPRPIRPSGAR